MPESDLEREQRAYRDRERGHGTKRLLMGVFLAALIAAGAYVMFSSSAPRDQVAQQTITAPGVPSMTPPAAPPPIPIPEAVPTPKAETPTPDRMKDAPPVTLPTPPAAPQ